MKTLRYLFAAILFALSLPSPAQGGLINVKAPGNLSDEIYRNGYQNAEELVIRGMVDDRDLMILRRMVWLRYLDLKQTNLRSIPSNAFSSMRNLATILLPNVTRIGGSAFENCTQLALVDIPSNVTQIGALAFYNCKSLSSVEIPRDVEKIGEEAFMSCSSLGKVIIEGTPTIGQRAFAGCMGLQTVICLSTTPPDIHPNAFEGTAPQKQLGVPAAAVEAYRTHPLWGVLFAHIAPAAEL